MTKAVKDINEFREVLGHVCTALEAILGIPFRCVFAGGLVDYNSFQWNYTLVALQREPDLDIYVIADFDKKTIEVSFKNLKCLGHNRWQDPSTGKIASPPAEPLKSTLEAITEICIGL